MQQQYENQYHMVEVNHWWFVARRQIVRDLVLAGNADRTCSILEVGSSAGLLMTKLLRDGYTRVDGIDTSPDAIERCRDAGLNAQIMDAQRLSFGDQSMDLITASDVLEHLEDERGALLEWRRVLKPGGLLIVFVPAFQFLWTAHDVANKHYRRYDRKGLLRALQGAGFEIERSSYWNAFLFPPVAAVRGLKRWLQKGRLPENGGIGDFFVPHPLVNTILLATIGLENQLFRLGVNWPFGVSAMALARRPSN
jgi:SAM-dependent methyltransferase